jgi:xanthine dehydrogenase iron-sulfur cluster and FAD-binding subunit A
MPSNQTNDPEIRTIRRSDSRVRLDVPAKLQLLSGLKSCRLVNLSRRGARVLLAERAPIVGASGVLKICGFEAFGDVIWSRASECGLRFDASLPLEKVVTVRHFSDRQSELDAAQQRTMVRNFVQGRPAS